MQIVHRISYNAKTHSKVGKKLRELGIKPYLSGNERVVLLEYFDIAEDNILWPKVEKILSSSELKISPTWTVFTKEEILAAKWVSIHPDYVWGYPMPDMDGGWKKISYTADKECSVCGIGLKQIAPINLREEPKLKENDFMMINWTFEIFARYSVLKTLIDFGIKGIEILPPIINDTGQNSTLIGQMKVICENKPCLIENNLDIERFACGHSKYRGLTRGMYKFVKGGFENVPDIIKTYEWFGNGHFAMQLTLASAKFVQLYYRNEWKGLMLSPIELI